MANASDTNRFGDSFQTFMRIEYILGAVQFNMQRIESI